MENILVKVEDISIQYKSITAVKNLSFDVKYGEIFAIIGPNGAGKTSAVECIEGLRQPTSGEIKVFGMTPHKNRKYIYQKIGIQLQEADYPDKIKVHELCKYYAAFYENPADWRLLLQQLDLEKRAKTLVKKLSGGEKRKLSILLALLPKPQLLILDELTTGLDPEARRMIWQSLAHIRDSGTSIILVSHYLDEIEYLANRLLYLVDGENKFVGTLKEFRQFAKKQLAEKWNEQYTLEQIYLHLSPKKSNLRLEVLS